MNTRNKFYAIFTFYAIFASVFIIVLCIVIMANMFKIQTHDDVFSETTTTTTSTCTSSDTETTTTTTTTTRTMTTTTSTTTSTATTTTESTTTTVCTTQDTSCRMVYDAVHKVFSRGTYYCGSYGTKGGSDRQLIDCSVGDGIIKGSVASYFLYNELGYNLNGNRTVVYVEVPDFPTMNGLYYVDDCSSANDEIIDFFYTDASHCPFNGIGVVTVKCYLINEEY